MNVYALPKRTSTEQSSSVEYPVMKTQEGVASSKIATAYTFLPCDLSQPYNVAITPVNVSPQANGIALFTTVAGWYVDSMITLSAVADLDTVAVGVAYNAGTLVRGTETGGVEAAYIALDNFTSTNSVSLGVDFTVDVAAGHWQKLATTTFLKIIHTSAGGSNIAHFHYLLIGI
jgi:hypothetical protein